MFQVGWWRKAPLGGDICMGMWRTRRRWLCRCLSGEGAGERKQVKRADAVEVGLGGQCSQSPVTDGSVASGRWDRSTAGPGHLGEGSSWEGAWHGVLIALTRRWTLYAEEVCDLTHVLESSGEETAVKGEWKQGGRVGSAGVQPEKRRPEVRAAERLVPCRMCSELKLGSLLGVGRCVKYGGVHSTAAPCSTFSEPIIVQNHFFFTSGRACSQVQ